MKSRAVSSDMIGVYRGLHHILNRPLLRFFGVPLSYFPTYMRMKAAGDLAVLSIPGMTRLDLLCLYDWALSMPQNGIAVEVGSYLGSSAACIAAGIRRRSGHLYCVDTWRNDGMSEGRRDIFDDFVSNTEPWQQWITPLRGYSAKIACTFDHPIDFLFIDADHSYEGCQQDIASWFPKVRTWGGMVFHDYPRAPGVARNVEELLKSNAVTSGQMKQHFFYCKKAGNRPAMAPGEDCA